MPSDRDSGSGVQARLAFDDQRVYSSSSVWKFGPDDNHDASVTARKAHCDPYSHCAGITVRTPFSTHCLSPNSIVASRSNLVVGVFRDFYEVTTAATAACIDPVHQSQHMVQVVNEQEHFSQQLLRTNQVVDVGPGVVPAGGAAAVADDR
jgi:hypothetical protein